MPKKTLGGRFAQAGQLIRSRYILADGLAGMQQDLRREEVINRAGRVFGKKQ